jgi:hypothetical protein
MESFAKHTCAMVTMISLSAYALRLIYPSRTKSTREAYIAESSVTTQSIALWSSVVMRAKGSPAALVKRSERNENSIFCTR